MDLTSLPTGKKKPKQFMFNSIEFEAELAITYRTDCENFLETFKQQQDCSFAAFTRIWKQENFFSIMKDISNVLTIETFFENCFTVTKKFLFSDDRHVQTGAFYVLYALYYKQPIRCWVKIRLTRTEFDKLCEIVNLHKATNLLEPNFIFKKMLKDVAFEFVALSQPLDLQKRWLRRLDLSSDSVPITTKEEGPLKKFKKLMEEDPDLVQFEETDNEYRKLAEKYREKHGNLYVFPSKVGEGVKRAYSEVFNVELEGEETEVEQEHLKQTKAKAMSNTSATYRGDRKVVTAMDLASTSKDVFN